ncbi:uncharacterized protein LOC110452841 isoform X2 [Mizuhopecten yessoensis]|uniref:uncharacterized protein LOC110452841 isoform X2 n=1 Tax=Mizuhopecten yessoensis TaxID=6573 RepID=UPI000B45804D|nr:uncharacterized protein LOC110452841 isoform X2 [Mizuhopecten yessoensis]
MAGNNKKWRLLWSERTYNLPEVIENSGIPVLVKVDEAIYEINDDRFTPGDLLQIHCKKTITKVVCHVLESGDGSGTQPLNKQKQTGTLADEDISIPVEYKRQLTIYRRDAGHKVYQTVPQLVEERPRFARVIDAFTDTKGNIISAKSDIELCQVEKGGGLSCVCDGYTYKLSLEQPIKCLLLSDNTKYTIQELIDTYPLPQTVEFCKAESPSQPSTAYTGVKDPSLDGKFIEIKSVMEQDVYIGTLNPFMPAQASTSKKGKRGSEIVVMPFDSVTTSQLEVKIPQQSDDPNYGMIMAKTSPKTDAALTVIKETIDTVNYPKVLFIPMKKPTPPVPSRPQKRTPGNSQGRPTAQSNNKDDDDDDSDYEPIAPPPNPPKPGPSKLKAPVLPKTKKSRSKSLPSKDEVNDPSLYSSQPQGLKYEDEDDHPYDEITDEERSSLRGRRPKSESDSVESTLSKVPLMVRESLLKVQTEFRNFWKNKITNSVSDDDQPSSEKRPGKVQRSQSSSFDNKTAHVNYKQHVKPPVQDPGPSDADEQTKHGIASKTGKKIADIWKKMKKPDVKEMQPPKFSTLDTSDLADYLRRCNLNAMADCVEEEQLNGSFFLDTTDEDLKSIFGLNQIQIMKFKKMRDEGWEPNK